MRCADSRAARRWPSGLDVEGQAGEVRGYLGPNGAGKRTTIRLLLGVVKPAVGEEQVLGMDVLAEKAAVHAGSGTCRAMRSFGHPYRRTRPAPAAG